jgi:diguanylate cyclase (GGDEF)-like protein
VARIGGDEFVALLPAHAVDRRLAITDALALAERIVAEMARPFQIGAIEHQASASVGVAIFDGTERSVDTLLKQADQAMYDIKAAGGNGVGILDASQLQAVGAQMREQSQAKDARLRA